MERPTPAGTISSWDESPEFMALQHPTGIFTEVCKITLLKAHIQIQACRSREGKKLEESILTQAQI